MLFYSRISKVNSPLAYDYITKPFDMQELLARIRAVLRRTAGVVDLITLGGVTVDFTRRVAMGPAGAIGLTNREFDILQFCVRRFLLL